MYLKMTEPRSDKLSTLTQSVRPSYPMIVAWQNISMALHLMYRTTARTIRRMQLSSRSSNV